jgi:hypothetical protein
MHTFIICGYGTPDDIRKDQNYVTYLHIAFNNIYSQVAGQKAAIIPCGGPTRCEAPFDQTEAGTIAAYLKELMSREQLASHTNNWNILPEEQSLSTLENLVFAKRIMDEQNIQGPITIFCEATRPKRLEAFAKQIWPNGNVTINAIDFDVSKNRYIDPEILEKKETLATKEGLWTLEDPERLERHHEFYERKFAFLRKRQSERLSHVDAVNEWLTQQERIMQELMPDHPLLQD